MNSETYRYMINFKKVTTFNQKFNFKPIEGKIINPLAVITILQPLQI
jgi:hypothetical protein